MTQGGARILVVDDEQAIRRFLQATLGAHGYQVYEADTGQEGLRAVPTCRPDAVILDLGLPDMDGQEVIRRLREWSAVPIIIVSAREHETEKVRALDAGADDYLTKPFAVGELMARLRAALRRAANTGNEPVYEVGDLCIDLGHREVSLAGQDVALTPTEYDLLRTLARHGGRVLTHRQLLREVWGASYEPDIQLLRVNISHLRRKLEPDPTRPQYIITDAGVGYRLQQC